MKLLTTTAKVTATKKLDNSVNGNPAYEIRMETTDKVLYGRTAPDAMCAYMLDVYRTISDNITYHFTPSGNLYIDYIRFIH